MDAQPFVSGDGDFGEPLPNSDASLAPDWSPDGRIVYNQGIKGSSAWGIWIISASGGEPQAWLAGPSPDIHPTWSPDGARFAYVRKEADGVEAPRIFST